MGFTGLGAFHFLQELLASQKECMKLASTIDETNSTIKTKVRDQL
jgi:hypothetical protein